MHAGSVLTLRPLTVTGHADGEFLVGDPARGEFVALPAIAVHIIDEIRSGSPLGTVAASAERRAGEPVDVVDFAETLVGLGFVRAVDGVPVDGAPPETVLRELPRWLVRAAGPLYSTPALVVFAVLFAGCVTVLTAAPGYRPKAADFFFLSDPVASLACLTVIAMAVAALHELAHWLGVRLLGLPASVTVSRRQFLLVLETDLTALWAVPRRQRWAPLAAGVALDTVVVGALLAAHGAASAGWWHPAPAVARLLAAVVAVRVAAVLVQFLVFMRTDVYAVMVVGLGCVNLARTNGLLVRRMLGRITEDERAELAAADARDLRVAAWYRWVYLGGIVLGVGYFLAFVVPATVRLWHWMGPALTHAGPGRFAFWEALVFGAVALTPTVAPAVIALRESGWLCRRRA